MPASSSGVAVEGDLTRLALALSRARGGDALTLVGMGGSMTADHGGMWATMQEAHALAYPGTSDGCGPGCVRSGWLLDAFEYLMQLVNSTRAQNMSAVVNAGLPGSPLPRYLDCTATLVPEDADIVIIDAATIVWGSGKKAAAVERVIRRILSFPRQPAVVLLHFFQFCNPAVQLQAERAVMHRNRSCYSPGQLMQSWQSARYIEDLLDRIASYYLLPAISARRALFDEAASGTFSPGDATHVCDQRLSAASNRPHIGLK